ncbi:hypothetical protein LRP88_04347 [Fusarium phalaenopsidis]|nr:GATase domain-containing protein [Fusarium sp. Ph1]
MAPYRIALLECDTPIQAIKDAHGTYGDLLKEVLEEGLNGVSSSVEPVYTSYDVVGAREYPKLGDVDCILMTGSQHDAFADIDWVNQLAEFIEKVYKTSDLPVVGVCFGHQIVARALGAATAGNPLGWEVAMSRINLTETGRDIFGTNHLMLQQMHRDMVMTLPESVQNIGSSSLCEIQGLYHPKRIFTMQAHPEFNTVTMHQIIDSIGGRLFDEEGCKAAHAQAEAQHDGVVVASAIWKFLLER